MGLRTRFGIGRFSILECGVLGIAAALAGTSAAHPLPEPPSFIPQAYLKASHPGEMHRFGYSVAAWGDTVVVGTVHEEVAGAVQAGTAYVYVRTGDTWELQARLTADHPDAGDFFGHSVSIHENTIVVGALGESSAKWNDPTDNSAPTAGAAYVFVREGATWTQQAYLKASNGEGGDWFGWAVTIWGDTVAVGAHYEDSSSPGVNGNQADNLCTWAGAVYIFTREGETWTQEAYLKASNPRDNTRFGGTVALWEDTLVVGSIMENSNATGVNGDQLNAAAPSSGAAYVFVREGGTWAQQAYLKASNTGGGDAFGASVAIHEDTIVVGARHERSASAGVNGNQADNSAWGAGAAYVFVREGATWTQQAYLKASNPGEEDFFGASVAITPGLIAVGAPMEDGSLFSSGVLDWDDDEAPYAGALYVFAPEGGTWTQQAYLKASNAAAFDSFGSAVALSGDVLVGTAIAECSGASGVNGDQENDSLYMAGAAYIFHASTAAAPCTGDLNGDGDVNGADLGLLLSAWGGCGVSCAADLNSDGDVNGADLGLLLAAWGSCP